MRVRWVVVSSLLWLAAGPAAAQPAPDEGPAAVDLDVSGSRPAPADDGAARARRGGELYEAERWAEARAEFVAAFEINPHPTYLFYIADTHRREAAYRQALLYYQRYLDSAPADSPFRPEATQRVGEVQFELDRRGRTPGAAGSAVLVVDGRARASSPAEPGVPYDPRRRFRAGFALAGATTAAALVMWGYAGSRVFHFEDEKDEALQDALADGVSFDSDEACDDAARRDGPEAERVDDACDSGRTWSGASAVFAVTSIVGAVATSYFGYRAFVEEGDLPSTATRPAPRSIVQVVPVLGPHAAGVDLAVRF